MPGLHTQNPRKLAGYDFYRQILHSPKYVVAPMVDQSELAWRILSRRYGGQLVYTPMINAKMFAEGNRKPFREQNFNISKGEEGGPEDRPLIVQFCANDPEQLLTSAKIVEPYCDAVDINLGCPQDIARRGHYGSFLQDEWDLIYSLINTLHLNLSVPVTAKFRVFPTVEKTVEYAKMLERAGAQILTCHGRTRDQRGQRSGIADWEKIRAVKEAVSVPVFANGNILVHSDIQRCLDATGADAVMSAEGNLYNPAIFLAHPPVASSSSSPLAAVSTPEPCALPSTDPEAQEVASAEELPRNWYITAETGYHPPHTTLALEYLAIVRSLATPTAPSAIKGHLFKLLRPALSRETDIRNSLGKVTFPKGKEKEGLQKYEALVREMDIRMKRDAREADGKSVEELVVLNPTTGLYSFPHWVVQPYVRPLPVEEQTNKNIRSSVADLKGSSPATLPAERDLPAEVDELLVSEEAAAATKRLAERVASADEETAKRVKLSED
ncbi:Dus-domain-containing protein [Cristinia sonorae]|uniref:tRNA-dihydrouridine(16/17) synthase [NAD(P)(+)] n=1 Tax=Cristinia sonorae TaxID=1940300 RepID=A0A8K0ULM1_9AGAR|nr:Dus-domain-containing protein [Cristinia sonorae]